MVGGLVECEDAGLVDARVDCRRILVDVGETHWRVEVELTERVIFARIHGFLGPKEFETSVGC
jgi:hypothetical protein